MKIIDNTMTDRQLEEWRKKMIVAAHMELHEYDVDDYISAINRFVTDYQTLRDLEIEFV